MVGETFGGQLTSRHLLRKFGYNCSHSAAFFNAHQKGTAEMWKSFRSAFAAHVDSITEGQARAAALATSLGLRQWGSQDSTP